MSASPERSSPSLHVSLEPPCPRSGRNVLLDRCRKCHLQDLSLSPIFFISAKALPDRHRERFFELPIFFTICLLSSSLTIHVAVAALKIEFRCVPPGGF